MFQHFKGVFSGNRFCEAFLTALIIFYAGRIPYYWLLESAYYSDFSTDQWQGYRDR